jgi:hypothetical protein
MKILHIILLIIFIIIILGMLFLIIYLKKKCNQNNNNNNNNFDITQICQVVNDNCIIQSSSSSNGKICFKKTSDNEVTITFSNGNRNFTKQINYDEFNSNELNPNSTLKIFTITLGFFKYPCYICDNECSNPKRIICIINSSQNQSQRLCYNMDTFEIFISGPTIPISTLQLKN